MIKNKLIIIPLSSPWDWTADYLRQTAMVLAKENKVVIFDDYKAKFFLKKKVENDSKKFKNIEFPQINYFLPFVRFKFIEDFNRKLSFFILIRKYKKYEKIFWFFNPEDDRFLSLRDKRTKIIYDCVDYHVGSLMGKSRLEREIRENKVLAGVDYVFVNSQSLFKLHKSKRSDLHLLKSQGFKLIEKKNKFYKIVSKNKKLITYIGGINYRFNFSLIYDLAKNNKQWQFLFVGPKQKEDSYDKKLKTKFWISKIESLENVSFFDALSREELYDLLRKSDLGIIPYNTKLDFNKYCYPMKVFEYLYSGKKVVSTEIDELKRAEFKNLVFIGKNYKEWQQIINRELNKPMTTSQKKKAKELAKANSWENKINQISEILERN